MTRVTLRRSFVRANTRATIHGVTFWRELTALYGLLYSYVGVEMIMEALSDALHVLYIYIYKDEQWLGLMLCLTKLLWIFSWRSSFSFSPSIYCNRWWCSTPCRVRSHIERGIQGIQLYSLLLLKRKRTKWKNYEDISQISLIWKLVRVESTKYVEAHWKRSRDEKNRGQGQYTE